MVKIRTLLNLLTYTAALLGVAPLYPYLGLPARLFCPLALIAGILCDRRGRYPLRGGGATLLTIALFLFYAARFTLADPIGPTVNILALLLAVRLATEKRGRDYLQIFVLTVFALAGASLLSLSAAFFLFLVLVVVCVTVGLVLLSFHSAAPELLLSRREARTLFAAASLLPTGSLILMLFLFLVLPRTNYPLWHGLNPTSATVGFTEEVVPGSVASVSTVKSVAFRAESPPLPPAELYWRGTVLNSIEEGAWVRGSNPADEGGRVNGGRPVRQTIYPEPTQGRYLFALDPPLALEGIRARRSADLVHIASRWSTEGRRKYDAVSAVGGRVEATVPDPALYLEVPGAVSARVREAAREIAAGAPTAGERIDRLEAFFVAQKLAYATDDLPGPEDPVDEFLFDKKRGYCEFFASSFAVLLRLSGVPARLVGGYFGGSYNALGGYYVITEDAAHVWVEALVEGEWLRIDPSRLARNAAAALVEPRALGLGAARRLLDAVNYFWNRTVISYDLGRQLQLLQQIEGRARRLRFSFEPWGLLRYLLPLVAVAVLAGVLHRLRISREERILRAFLRRVKRKHRLDHIPEDVGLEELAGRVDDPLCREFVRLYGRAIYRDRGLTGEELTRLREIVRTLR